MKEKVFLLLFAVAFFCVRGAMPLTGGWLYAVPEAKHESPPLRAETLLLSCTLRAWRSVSLWRATTTSVATLGHVRLISFVGSVCAALLFFSTS